MLVELKLTQDENLGVMAAFQRYRLRRLYNIKGNCLADVLLPILCTVCANVHIDREIRVREGDPVLISRSGLYRGQKLQHAPEVEPINRSPPRIEPMRYVSPRETSEHTSHHSSTPTSHPQGYLAPGEDQNVELQVPRPAYMPQKYRQGTDGNPHQKIQAESRAGVAEDLLAPNDDSSSEGRNTPRATNEMIERRVEQDGLPPYSKIPVENQLIDLHPKSPATAAKRAECGTDITDILDGSSDEHNRTGSEARDDATSLRGKRSNIGTTGGHELSYVHDFSDCPVNKSVLMYYEKEENKLQKPTIDDGAGTSLSSNNPYQHILSNCPGKPSSSGHDVVTEDVHQDVVTDENAQLSDTAAYFSWLTGGSGRDSSHSNESNQKQVNSDRGPNTRSAEGFPSTSPPYDVLGPRADKKAVSF
jgi:hypothetical protein